VSFDRASLPPMEVAGRSARLRSELTRVPCDALLVTNLTNVRYLTGFSGSAALLLVPADEAAELVFVTDGRYRDQATSELAEAGVEARTVVGLEEDARRHALTDAVAGIARVGLESENVTWAQKRRFDKDWFIHAKLVPTTGLVESLRLVKDAGEVARIQAACAMADGALAAVRHRLGEGVTEAEVALELEWQMRRLGADGLSFETIVASGPNAAMPHHQAGARRIVEGDLVVLDFGALVDGYHSDMTRTVMVGEPSGTQSRMYEVVREAQAAGVAAVKAGADAKAVDDACRSVIREAGWGEAFLHATGHGVGLDIHEPPRVARTTDDMLADGHVVTVEPGVYLAEHGGVRIEDTVVVTSEGCRTLTRAPKEPQL
jgi:Xaa-Pro aminopeptidase